MGFGWTEWLLILAIVLVIFGGSRLPALGEALGKGIRNFKRSFSGQDALEVNPEKKELSEESKEKEKQQEEEKKSE